MARKLTLQQLIDSLTDDVRDAFVDSIANIRSDAQIRLLAEAIEDQNIDAVLRLLRMDRAYFEPLDTAINDAYKVAGVSEVDDLLRQARSQGVRVVHRFDVMNPRAQQFALESSSRRVVEITDDTRAALRRLLSGSFDRQQPPRETALDIVGRINNGTGKREGGILGLTTNDMALRDRAFNELRSGDPAQLANYLTRRTRDRRFDPIVEAALEAERPVPLAKARAMTVKMENKLLRLRGERIARTELLGSLHHAADEAVEQMIDAGQMTREAVTNIWDSAQDGDTRPSHQAMNGDEQPQGAYFVSGDGNRLKYPGDRSGGAPASDIINCRCTLRRRVDFIGDAIARGLVEGR